MEKIKMGQIESEHGLLSATTLKIIACLSMLIDHTAVALIPYGTPTYIVFRIIGRFAFPIFCFLLVEGAFYTSSKSKYILRLAIFALLSEIPYNLLNSNDIFYLQKQNVFFTLLLGFTMICILDTLNEKYLNHRTASDNFLQYIAVIVLTLGFGVVNELIHADYGLYGITLISLFYLIRKNSKWLRSIPVLIFSLIIGGLINKHAALAIIPILLYSREKDLYINKYFFYTFYPLHITILVLFVIFLT